MRIRDIIKTLPVLGLLCTCQSEALHVPVDPEHIFIVKATLPETSDKTRTHITYGYPNIEEELFRWHENSDSYNTLDYIWIFNLSQESIGIQLETSKVTGNTAIFESFENNSDFSVKAGDVLFVSYWGTESKIDENGRNVFEVVSETKTQPIVEDSFADDYMEYMQGSLKMYDIVTVEEDGKIPDIHFNHLSGIMRVTLRNETDANIYPKSLTFECKGEEPIFITKLYCGVDTEAAEGPNLFISDKTEYSASVSNSTNNYTAAPEAAVGGAIAPGKTYELYVPFMPRFENDIQSDNLVIKLEIRGSSSESDYPELTLNDFKTTLEAGKRYWFNLTTVGNIDGERRLMLTSDWLKQQEQNQGSSDQSSSGDE